MKFRFIHDQNEYFQYSHIPFNLEETWLYWQSSFRLYEPNEFPQYDHIPFNVKRIWNLGLIPIYT